MVRVSDEEGKEENNYSSFLPHFKTYVNKVYYYASSLFEVFDKRGNLEKNDKLSNL